MAVKRSLAKKKIYVPTLWPDVDAPAGNIEKDYAENILPLPDDLTIYPGHGNSARLGYALDEAAYYL